MGIYVDVGGCRGIALMCAVGGREQVERVDMKHRYAFVYMPLQDAEHAVKEVKADQQVPYNRD